eukprot:GHVQ01035082.1.p1 GENE.GHVQ01035082.1~~GHVQ01035082.1.p1  ORF type:complete len:271 (-),score=14.94 GHVQ01035082.1:318-1130(-)
MTCQPSMRLPLLFIDTADSLLRSQFEQAACNSRQNPVEVEIVARVVDLLVADGVRRDNIGILTAYSAHRNLLKNRIHYQNNHKAVLTQSFARKALRMTERRQTPVISTVDGFQGFENDFIIFSAVRSSFEHSIGFLMDHKRMNVALTRARRGLIVVGDSSTLRTDKLWNDWCTHVDVLGARHSLVSPLLAGSFASVLQSQPYKASKSAQPYLRERCETRDVDLSDQQLYALRKNIPSPDAWSTSEPPIAIDLQVKTYTTTSPEVTAMAKQ